MNRLDGKVALLSGAARGIGAETARKMASAGASVVIGDVLADRARETAKEITAAGGKALALVHDVTTEASWTAAVAATIKQFGKLDILVNNAGIFLGKDLMDATMEDWIRLVSINMTGVWLGTKVRPRARRERQVEPARFGDREPCVHRRHRGFAARPALLHDQGRRDAIHQVDGSVLRAQGLEIRVNSIHPGVIETDMGAQTFVSRARQAGSNDVEGARSVAMKQHPIGDSALLRILRSASCSWRPTTRAS